MSFFLKVKEKLVKINIVERLIYSIIAIFILQKLLNTFSFFLNQENVNFIINWFSLSPSFNSVMTTPYTLLTYGFLHVNFIHLIFNLIVLFYFGNLFLDYFSSKKVIIYFLFGVFFGGLFFIFSNNYFEVFKNQNYPLVGASAGITAIIVGLATYMPNYEMNFRFIGFIKLWILTFIWVFLSFVLIPNGNGGGQIAHLGGAFIGFVLTKYFMGSKLKPKKVFKKTKKANLKTVYKNTDKLLSVYQKDQIKQRKIDELLDKINKSGYEALTASEKSFLDTVSKN